MPLSSMPLYCCILVGIAALAVAQQPTPQPVFDLRHAHGAVLGDDGTPWLVGPDYKAACRDGALHFMPALGSDAPTTASLTFALSSIRRGETEQLADAPVAPTPHLDGNRVRFVRAAHAGRTITENYEATAAGVEQTFVFAQRPAGSGDLVVRGALRTALTATTTHDATLCFTDARGGGVRIGGVTGIDAEGRRCAGSSRVVDGRLELRLPADFVEGAAYPLTLDPLFGATLSIGGTTYDDEDVDAAYDAATATWFVVWERAFSSGDRDIRGQRMSSSGTLVGGLLAVTTASEDDIRPAVALVASRQCFVVCWQSGTGPFGPYDIVARSVGTTSGTLGAIVGIGVGANNDILPAISGDRSSLGTQALVAWVESGSGLLTRPVTVSSTGVLSPGTTKVITTTSLIQFPPQLIESRRPGDVGLIAWCEYSLFASARARAISYGGDPLGTSQSLFSLSADQDVAIGGDDGQFLIAHDGSPTSSTSVQLRSAQWNGIDLSLGASVTIPNTGNAREYSVGFLGDRFLVAWCQPTTNPFDGEVRAVAVKPDCTICSPLAIVPTVVRPNQRAPAVATQFAGTTTGAAPEALLLWCETDAAPPFPSSVVGQLFAAMQGAPPVVLSPGCPGGGTAGTNGPFALGNANFQLTLSGADPAAPLALLGLSAGGLAPIPCGCTFLQALQTSVVPMFAGQANAPFVVPCDPQFLGFALEYQWIAFGTTTSPCPLLPNISGSVRRLLTLSQ